MNRCGFSLFAELGVGGAGYQRIGNTWAFEASSNSFFDSAIDYANSLYNEYLGKIESYLESSADNYSFGTWNYESGF